MRVLTDEVNADICRRIEAQGGRPHPTFRDGTSDTIIVGEAVSDIRAIEDSAKGGRRGTPGYPSAEPSVGNRKDHWYIGSDSIDGNLVAGCRHRV